MERKKPPYWYGCTVASPSLIKLLVALLLAALFHNLGWTCDDLEALLHQSEAFHRSHTAPPAPYVGECIVCTASEGQQSYRKPTGLECLSIGSSPHKQEMRLVVSVSRGYGLWSASVLL
jgi:hypothetical protein